MNCHIGISRSGAGQNFPAPAIAMKLAITPVKTDKIQKEQSRRNHSSADFLSM
jgi:hypothetical protein